MIIGIDASRAVTRQRTGTEAYAYFLIQHLIRQAPLRNHHLRLYFNQAPSPDLFPDAPHVEQIVIPFPRLWTHIRLAWELHRRPPDVFFTPAHVIPYTYRGPSVATIHDLGYVHFPEAHPRRQLNYLHWSTRHNATVGRRVIADSLATKADLSHIYGIPADKIDVVYPAVDPTIQPVEDPVKMQQAAVLHNVTPPYFLYIGTLQPRKNLVRLIRAYMQSGVHYQLVLAGKVGWLAGPILGAISHYQTEAEEEMATAVTSPHKIASRPSTLNVMLTGYVSDNYKAALISGATAVLYPSLYEGFGFPALEAQACGTPLLCANTSSLPEVVGDGALQVDPLDIDAISIAIQRLASDPLLREELIEKGFENVANFTWESTAVDVLDTLEKASTT